MHNCEQPASAPQLRILSPEEQHHACGRSGRITDLLHELDLPLNTRCGERGTCQGCQVQLVDGTLLNDRGEIVSANGRPVTIRGCEARWHGQSATTIRVPARSLLAQSPQIVDTFKLNIPRASDPIWQQHDMTGTPPAELRSGLARRLMLADASLLHGDMQPIEGQAALFATVERWPEGWTVTDVSAQCEAAPLGLAIDIGTTTVAVLLVELLTGRILGRASAMNRQAAIGDDVLTRINACVVKPRAVQVMQRQVIEQTLAPLVERVLAERGIAPQRVKVIVAAGNTTMLHLLAGLDPSPMGVAPFTPGFLDHRRIPARELGWSIDAAVHLLPGASAYVGADLTAGACATGLIYDDQPTVLADIGTNGEMVLKVGSEMWGCATAAGPAFEGVGLTSGMAAARGAIDHVTSAAPGGVTCHVIGDVEPVGLCGSAYIDLLAVGRADGWLTATGRLDDRALRAAGLTLTEGDGRGRGVRLCDGPSPIILHEQDVARLMQAKAAIAAGVKTLLAGRGLEPGDVHRLYLAGGFGLHIDVANAIAIGLFPGFRSEQIQPVGNSALAGAYLSLLDCALLEAVAAAGADVRVIELNQDPAFENCYIDHLRLTAG